MFLTVLPVPVNCEYEDHAVYEKVGDLDFDPLGMSLFDRVDR